MSCLSLKNYFKVDKTSHSLNDINDIKKEEKLELSCWIKIICIFTWNNFEA